MTFDHLSSLPIIHIAPYLKKDDHRGRASMSAALHAACVEYGFFYLDLTGFADPEEAENLARLGRQFFELPQEIKDELSIKNQDGVRGESSPCRPRL